MTPKAVVFDIGNVLLGWDPEGFYDREIGPEARAALFREVPLHEINLRVDAGASFKAEIAAAKAAHPNWAGEIEMWSSRWFELASPLIPEAIALRDAVRAKGIKVFALTNFGKETWERASAKLPFLLDFDRLFISGHLGVLKPEPEIYAIVERSCALKPYDLLFTDDRADNIAAAARRGWRTHQFESWQGWARRLVAEGLLSDAEAGLSG